MTAAADMPTNHVAAEACMCAAQRTTTVARCHGPVETEAHSRHQFAAVRECLFKSGVKLLSLVLGSIFCIHRHKTTHARKQAHMRTHKHMHVHI